jgi:tetratricopeptide (TPR) repeat protein
MRQVLALLAAAEEVHAWVFDAGRKTDPATGGVLTPLSEQFEGLEVGLLARLLDLDRPGAAASYDRIDPGLLVTLQTLQGAVGVARRKRHVAFPVGAEGVPAGGEGRPDPGASVALDAGADFDPGIRRDRADEQRRGRGRRLLGPTGATGAAGRGGGASVRFGAGEAAVQPDELAALLRAHADTLENQGLALERVPWLTLIAALRLRPGEASASPEERYGLSGSLQNRGNAKRSGGDLIGAIADCDAAIRLREAIRDLMGKSWPAELRNGLARSLWSRGTAKADSGDLGGAVSDLDSAIGLMDETRKELGAAWPVPWRNDLAGSLQNRGLVKAEGGDLAGAIADYDAAIRLGEAVRDLTGEAWPVPLRNDLANSLQHRGKVKAGRGDLAGAIADYDAAIGLMATIRDSMAAAWPVPMRNRLAGALQNRANAKAQGAHLAEALADFDAAVEMMEAIHDMMGAAWPVRMRNDLAGALQDRAAAKQNCGDLAGATADYDAAIGLMEAIRDVMGATWPVPYRFHLAMSFYNRALAGTGAGSRRVAAVDVAACLAIQRPLVASEPFRLIPGRRSVPSMNGNNGVEKSPFVQPFGSRSVEPQSMPNVGSRCRDETPEAYDSSRRRGGVSALGRRGAEGDAHDRLPEQHLADTGRSGLGRIPPRPARNRLRRGTKRGV